MLQISNSYQQNPALQNMLIDPYYNQMTPQSLPQFPQFSDFTSSQIAPQSCNCNSVWQSAIGAISNMFDRVMNIVMSLYGAQNTGINPGSTYAGQIPANSTAPGSSSSGVTGNSSPQSSASGTGQVHFLDKVKELVNKGKDFLSDGKEVFSDIQSAFKSGWETASDWAGVAWNTVKDWTGGAWNTVKDWASSAISWIF